jgi:outer membrane immunogenic protein
MKRLAGTLACVCAVTSTGFAADLGKPRSLQSSDVYEESRPAVWQGFYAGIMLGANGTALDVDKVGTTTDLKATKAGIGGFAGYNFANNGPWIWGVEADLQGHGFDSKKPKAVTGLGNVSGESALLGSLRLRGGYAWNNVLLYGTAGLAITDLEAKSSLGGKASFKTGLAFGLGAEWAFDKAWTARVEGIGYVFGSDDTLAGSKRETGLATSSIRFGLARKF